jgi:hypothetical protein
VPHLTTVNNPVEACTIASLHAHAVGVHNIRSLVPITLDIHSTQYSHWCNLIMVTLQFFTLDDHVIGNTAHSTTLSRLRMDNFVLSWLLSSLSVDFQMIIR